MASAHQSWVTQEKVPLWQNDTVAVAISGNHLRIYPRRLLARPEELNRKEVLEIWETSKKIAGLCEEVFKTRDYLEYTPVYNDGRPFYVEIIPVDGTSEFVDMAKKMERTIYVVSGAVHDNCQLTGDQIEKIQKRAQEILGSPAKVPGNRGDNPGSWEIPWGNMGRAADIVREKLSNNQTRQSDALNDLEQKDEKTSRALIIQGEFDHEKEVGMTIKKIKTCAFCNPQIIEKQRIVEGLWHHVLFNHIPFIAEKHLLIVSKEHCLSREHFHEDEVWEEHELFVRVGKVFQSLFGESTPFCRFTQKGSKAGESVLHPHSHFLAGIGEEGLKSWLQIVVQELDGNMQPPLNTQQMQEVTKRYRDVLTLEP